MGFLDDVKLQIDGQLNRNNVDIAQKVKITAESIKTHYMINIQRIIKNNEKLGTKNIDTISCSDFLVLTFPWVTVEREDKYPGFGEESHRVNKVKTNEIAFEFNKKLREYLKDDGIVVGDLQKACLEYDSYDTPRFDIDKGIFLYPEKYIKILDRLSVYSDIEVHYIRKKKSPYDGSYISQNNKRVYLSSVGPIGEYTGMKISFRYPD